MRESKEVSEVMREKERMSKEVSELMRQRERE